MSNELQNERPLVKWLAFLLIACWFFLTSVGSLGFALKDALTGRPIDFWIPVIASACAVALAIFLLWVLAPRRSSVTLTPHSLGRFLERMGYQFQTVPLESGEPLYDVTHPNGPVRVQLSRDGSNLWITASFGNVVTDPASSTRDALVQILKTSWKTAPAFFVIEEPRNLCLYRAIENRDLTPARFRTAFDELLYWASATRDQWFAVTLDPENPPAQTSNLPEELRHAIRPTP